MLNTFLPLFSHILRRNFRLRAGLFIACWFLLNMQLAIAFRHDIQTQPLTSDAQINLMSDGLMYSPLSEDNKIHPLCEKHCHPDGSQVFSPSLQLNAIPVESSIVPVTQMQESSIVKYVWYHPPTNGPPAEILFCRFRE